MSIIVGVDAGGTTTRVAAERDGVRIGMLEAEPANLRTHGVDAAAETISRAIDELLAGEHPRALVVGAAGAGSSQTAQALRAVLEERFPGARVAVEDDATIALRALVEGDGIVLVSGTGSIAVACVGGARYRAGGHGALLGDEGSGGWIGAAAVRQLLRHYDGRAPRDAMTDALAKELGSSIDDVHHRIYGDEHPARRLAALAPLVLTLASDGERSATKIVQAAALELADLVKTVVRAAGCERSELPVVLAGGLLAQNSLLTYLLETRIANELPSLVPRKNPPPAYEGALVLARGLL